MLGAFRIRTLLVAVALLPLAGLAFFAAREVVEQRTTVRNAGAVIADAELVAPLLTAREAATTEHNAAESVAEAAVLGIDPEFIIDVVGIDLRASLAPARERLDAALEQLEAATRTGAPVAARPLVSSVLDAAPRIDELRADVDSATVSPFSPGEYQALVLDPITQATHAQFDQMTASAQRMNRGGAVERAGALARQASDVADLLRREGIQLAMYVVPFRPAGDDPARDLSYEELVAASAVARNEIATLEAMMDPSLAEEWEQQVLSDPVYRGYLDLLDTALAGEIDPLGSPDMSNTVMAAEAAVHNSLLTADFARLVNDRVIAEAEGVAAVADADLDRLYLLAGLIALATLLTIALLSRSIARPLSRLEHRARRITDGDLGEESEPGEPTGGPREVRVVDRAIDELVAGLQVLETQAMALSRGETDAPELQTASPGRIGESLQASVRRLSDMATRLDHQARHDQLTGLYNRTAGIEGIEKALDRARRTGRDVAVLFIDLDGFKEINDVHGHAIGDEVLIEVAQRLRRTARTTDLVARLGGDEFIFVLEDQEEVATAVTVADRIVELLREPVTVDDITTSLSASIGIAWSPHGATAAAELLVQADLALYRAKARGKARTELFDEHLQKAVDERVRVETALTEAIAGGQLEVWYQPIVHLGSERPWGLEALVRWRRDDGTLIPPLEFIPIAERSDLILDLDRYVLEAACRQLAAWDAEGFSTDLHLDVNISGRHLETGDLPGATARILAETGIDPGRVVLEITETRLMRDLTAVEQTVEQLCALGVRIAIDDFGTGYASVAQLRQVPATHLKIDRSFVGGATAADRSLLELLVTVGEALGMEVIAEGIETEDQQALLTDLGCPIAQGFHFARPMPAPDVVPWLTSSYARLGSSDPA